MFTGRHINSIIYKTMYLSIEPTIKVKDLKKFKKTMFFETVIKMNENTKS